VAPSGSGTEWHRVAVAPAPVSGSGGTEWHRPSGTDYKYIYIYINPTGFLSLFLSSPFQPVSIPPHAICALRTPFYQFIIMFGTDQPISVGIEDPEYYAELLRNTHRLANRRLPFDEESCSDIPGIQNVDGPLAKRLQTLLDIVADISLCQRGNVSATMASLKDDKGTLQMQLYIIFNHEDDEAARSCSRHLQSIFAMLRKVPYKPPAMDGSPKVIGKELEDNLIEICRAIHNYSFDIFAHRVTKREDNLSDIWTYVEQDRTQFTPEQRSTLLDFLQHVDGITKTVAKAQRTKQLSIINTQMLLDIYQYWKKVKLLPEDSLANNRVTLLDNADMWLADSA
jgi:hypothetical protein